MLLGACGSSTARDRADAGLQQEAPGSSGPKTTDGDKKSDGDKKKESVGSPLDQLFGDPAKVQRATEDAIATCMRARGWDYTPNTANAGPMIGGVADTFNDPKFREKYGYGISTQPPPEAYGTMPTANAGTKDPNTTYREKLSAREQAQYDKDLIGDPVGSEPGSSGGAISFGGPDDKSCSGQAMKEVSKRYPELSTEFSERLGALLRDLDNDPAMKAALKEWSACISKQSFTYASIDELMADLQKRANEIFGIDTPSGVPMAIGIGGVGSESAGYAPTTSMSADAQARLRALQREERALATADYPCRVNTVDKVRPKLELRIADKLRSEFPGLGGAR